MKRNFFMVCAAVVSMTLAVSCTSGAKSENASAESGSVTADLLMDELTGKVKLCKTTTKSCNEQGVSEDDMIWSSVTKVYDEEGYLDVNAEELDWRMVGPRLTRNDKKQITQVAWRVPEFEMDVTDTYEYNADGTVKSCVSEGVESIDELKYYYDEDKHLKCRVSDGAGEGSVFRSTSEYTVLDTDEQGNWTRRLVKATYESGPDDGSGKFDETFISYELEVREIVYY